MELESNDTTTICLFCPKKFPDTSIAIEHLKDHAFDLSAMKAKFQMDQYSFIKVNNKIPCVFEINHFIIDRWLTISEHIISLIRKYLPPL